jgi:membrane carboxypeptidase/penicillin-binding protein PbpC
MPFKSLLSLLFSHIGILICLITPGYTQCLVQATVQHASCSGQDDGAIVLQVTGASPYKFEWSNGANTQNITSLNPGIYTVKVTDARGSEKQLQVNVENRSSLKVEKKIIQQARAQHADGKIEVLVSGGAAPYTFSLSDYSSMNNVKRLTQKNNTFKGLTNGKYIIDVMDAKGCMATISIHLK